MKAGHSIVCIGCNDVGLLPPAGDSYYYELGVGRKIGRLGELMI